MERAMERLSDQSDGRFGAHEDVIDRGAPDEPGAAHQLSLLFIALRQRLGLLALCIIGGTALGILLGAFVTPQYTASTLIAIEPNAPELVALDRTGLAPVVDPAAIRTEITVLTSREHARRVVEELDLDEDPAFVAEEEAPDLKDHILSWVREPWVIATTFASDDQEVEELALEAEPVAEEKAETAELPPVDEAAGSLQRQLWVTHEEDSRLITVRFTSPDAEKAALIANTVGRVYLEAKLQNKREEASEASLWLSQRLELLRSDVERAEAAIQRYRSANGLAPADKTDTVDEQLADINRQLAGAQAELAERRARLELINELRRRGDDLMALPEVVGSTVINDLRRREGELLKESSDLALTYGAKHPRLRQVEAEQAQLAEKIRLEVDRIVDNVANETRMVEARRNALALQLESLRGATRSNLEAAVKLRELERKAEAAQRLYELFLQRSREITEHQSILGPDARIVASAVPPTSPSTLGMPIFAVLGFTTSSIIGVLLALVLDRLDNRLRSEAHVREALRTPCFALVPRLHKRRLGIPVRRGRDRLMRTYLEAIRSIVTALQGPQGGMTQVVLLASAVPGEGRTTLTASLAAYAARINRRVLMISLAQSGPQGKRKAGQSAEVDLVEHLVGGRPVDELIARDEVLRIDYVTARSHRRDLMTLVLSGRLELLLSELRNRYDLILIDSPPVLASADARALAPLADTTLFVVQWDSTPRTVARNAMRILQEAHGSVVGSVLTQVDVDRHARYGYGDIGYYYEHFRNHAIAPPPRPILV